MVMLAKKLEKTRFPLGELERNSSGMISFPACRSTNIKIPPEMREVNRAATMMGWLHGSTFPPRFNPMIRNVTQIACEADPIESKLLRTCSKSTFSFLASCGPKSSGIVTHARAKANMITGTGGKPRLDSTAPVRLLRVYAYLRFRTPISTPAHRQGSLPEQLLEMIQSQRPSSKWIDTSLLYGVGRGRCL